MTGYGAGAQVYPVSLRLAGRLAVVIGGGTVALRRVTGLRAAGADVLVVAPELTASLADLAARGLIKVHLNRYQVSDLDGAWLVHVCTDQPAVNAAVAADAERLRLWCVRADDAEASAAWTPAVGRTLDATIAVNAGCNPRRAAALRDRCMEAVEAAAREDRGATPDAHSAAGAEQAATPIGTAGRVTIVGGGPGHPELITVAGMQRLRTADVVVTDRLAPASLLADLAPEVLVIDAAKVPGGASTRQDAINAALVEHARAGRSVVRLKGGDPFVFGRGMEEVEACRTAGVPVAVVPGVTSAVSVPGSAGIPVTHRGLSQGFAVVSGHVSPSDPRSTVNWGALARSGTTLVLLMAVEHLAAIAEALIAAGLPAGTASACVADGWTDSQQVVSAPLSGLAAAIQDRAITSPAVIVIGDTARYASVPGPAPIAEPGTAVADAANGPARRVLVIGGSRSGKSAVAEGFLVGCRAVDYVATGLLPSRSDAEWAARVDAHRRRRPAHWRTIETIDLDPVLRSADTTPVLVDCLSTWLAQVMDESDAWQGHPDSARTLAGRADDLVDSWRASTRPVVAVTSEVGCGVVPGTVSGRVFRDTLGNLNARIAAESDEVWLCTAGVPRRLR
ncbi:MAG: uroporphyrinogen-III C-methyltransferase [Streptosporangiaceae bacterium]